MKKIVIRIIILVILCFMIIGSTNKAQAVLQADGSSSVTYNVDQWMENIRYMEGTSTYNALGGALGLSEEIDKTTNGQRLKATTESNNLDIHMQKSTEYGAMAILSASSYGNPNKIEANGTTTGNKSGIYMPINKEWVSGGKITNSKVYQYASPRYKVLYTANDESTAKVGDATVETKGWHGSGSSEWFNDDYNSGLVRSHSGSIFSYYGNGNNNNNDGNYTKTWSSRTVVVVGSGLLYKEALLKKSKIKFQIRGKIFKDIFEN